MLKKYGSGTGSSFDADYLKCRRLFYWRHQQGVRPRAQGDGAALVVGTAGHAWMERFHEALSRGDDTTAAVSLGDAAFAWSLEEMMPEAKGLGFDLITTDERASVAINLLHALAPQFARRIAAGERTVANEMEGTLTLPPGPGLACRTGEDPLRNFTVAIDRVFYHPGDEEQPITGLAIDEYKFTSMASTKQYAENMLMNDQTLGYLYWLDRAAHNLGTSSESIWNGAPVVGVRYRIFRVDGKISAASYHETWETVDRGKLDDWYNRKVALRAEMSAGWEKPMDAWPASRYAFGPCHTFGRECPYAAMCDEPGAEREKVGQAEDANSPYVRDLSPDS